MHSALTPDPFAGYVLCSGSAQHTQQHRGNARAAVGVTKVVFVRARSSALVPGAGAA